jgi:two-component system, LytTR family, response regulator
MKKYTAYIVDDEPLAIKSLTKKLEDFPNIEVIGESTRMAKAIIEINMNKPDILFLDIQLAEGTGFDLINKLDYSGKIIFITAFDEFAFRAFEINALDYLLKPISTERLRQALEKLFIKDSPPVDLIKEKLKFCYNDRIMAYDKNQIRFLLLSDVVLISASRDYSVIELVNGKEILFLRSMGEWDEKLPPEHFIRIHRSYIVNLNYIDKILRYSTNTAKVFIKNHPEPISLSRTFYKNLKIKYL